MTEADEVAASIYAKHSKSWPVTTLEAEALVKAYLDHESQQVQTSVVDALVNLNCSTPQPLAPEGKLDFWAWLDKAYHDGSKDEHAHFTKYNMEVAYNAGCARLQAEVSRLTDRESAAVRASVYMAKQRDALQARTAELEKVLHILAANPSGSIRHYINTINAALVEGAKS